jgi:hypothetical protein
MALASQVDVCNYAMTILGEEPITSLLDNTPRARALNAVYNTERQAELTANFWNFSITRAQLPALTQVPLYQFTQAYQLPSNFLKLIDVGDQYPSIDLSDYIGSDDSQWAVEGQTICCNYAPPMWFRYCADVTNEGMWDPAFVRAFSCKLASVVAEKLTQNTAKCQKADAQYQKALMMAIRADAMQIPPKKPNDDTWMISRINW